MHDAFRVLAGAGAATVVGCVYYSPVSPAGRLFMAQMERQKSSGKGNGGAEGQQVAVAMGGSIACAAAIAGLCVVYGKDRELSQAELLRFAGRMTVMGGLLDLPHNLFENRGLPSFFVHRGYDFCALLAIVATVNALRG